MLVPSVSLEETGRLLAPRSGLPRTLSYTLHATDTSMLIIAIGPRRFLGENGLPCANPETTADAPRPFASSVGLPYALPLSLLGG